MSEATKRGMISFLYKTLLRGLLRAFPQLALARADAGSRSLHTPVWAARAFNYNCPAIRTRDRVRIIQHTWLYRKLLEITPAAFTSYIVKCAAHRRARNTTW
jgi:hypothetical protein